MNSEYTIKAAISQHADLMQQIVWASSYKEKREMNYFPFDPDPTKAARALDDKRLRRVFQEAVMVSAELQRIFMPEKETPYPKKIPIPRALIDWLTMNTDHELWFAAWTNALYACCIERFGCGVGQWVAAVKYRALVLRARSPVYRGPPIKFVNLAHSAEKGLNFKHVKNVHEAYRAYVAHQWASVDKRPVTWTVHGAPSWVKDYAITRAVEEM